MDNNLNIIKVEIYDKCELKISEFIIETESKEYDACRFKLNGLSIISRSAKITPKKIGQFVTFWKRNKNGITEPFSEIDLIDFYVINVKTENGLGQFVFPKSELINKGIVTTNKKDGKRGFRVYPKWSKTTNKQAEKTQKWQMKYFYEVNEKTNFKRVKELYNGN